VENSLWQITVVTLSYVQYMFSKSKSVDKHKHCDVKLGQLYEMAPTDAAN